MSKEAKVHPKTLLEKLDFECPPFWAYYYARKTPHGRWVGLDELCRRSGIPRRTVIRIGSKISWRGVGVEVASRFLAACGIKPASHNALNLRLIRKYVKSQHNRAKNPYWHLTKAQWRMLNVRSEEWLEAQRLITSQRKPAQADSPPTTGSPAASSIVNSK